MLIPGLVSITFRKRNPSQIVELCRENGLCAIEWGGDVHVPHGDFARAEEVRRLTLDAGLSIAAYGAYYRCGVSEASGLSFQTVLETAVVLGAPSIRVWAGNQGSAASDPSYRQQVAKDCHRICALAEQRHIKVALEYHNHTLTDTIDSCLELCHAADHPNLQTLWQPRAGQAAASGSRQLALLSNRLLNIHVFHWTTEAPTRRPLAEGFPLWTQWINHLKRSHRTHHLLLEFVRGDTPESLAEDARALLEMLKSGTASQW